MADIYHTFPIAAPCAKVFDVISSPAGLDQWWTIRAAGVPESGATYELWFGAEYDWRAVVTRCLPSHEFELQLTVADGDWTGSRVGFRLEPREQGTWVQFHHEGWPAANEHFRISNHCWGMYLRVMRRYLEHGETVPYEQRLSV